MVQAEGSSPLRRFDGKTALVTGASRGIGRAIALRLGREGARVAVNFVADRKAADEVVAALEAAGTQGVALQADVGDRAAVEAMVRTALDRFGRIDVLVNNAAVVHHGDLFSYSDAALHRDLDEMWRVNVLGLIHTARAVVPGMSSQRSGSIVNVVSIAGYANASAGTTFYGSTKAAAINLTKRLAFELGSYAINVNAVAPGLVRTGLLSRGRSAAEVEKMIADFASRSMLQRVGEPEDIAAVVAFLASPDAAFVTGQILTADGGRMDYLTFSG